MKKPPVTIYATINKEHTSCSFKNNEKEYEKILHICSKCKHFDDESDFPNCFCSKSCEMIDFWFNTLKCPLNNFKIVNEQEYMGNKRKSSEEDKPAE